MFRKISSFIENHLKSNSHEILCIDGARQVGKTYIIREIGKKLFTHFVEINFAEDSLNNRYFANVASLEDFHLILTAYYGNNIGNNEDTLIFLDEIQVYPRIFSLLKAISTANQYKVICSGSELGLALKKDYLTPMGYVITKRMYPMDFEEFLYATGSNFEFINQLREFYKNRTPINSSLHNLLLKKFKTYLYVGGMPASVKAFVETKNVLEIRKTQSNIIAFYKEDASKYDESRKLKIKRIYEMIPSNLENKVKRIQFTDIENIHDARFNKYIDEFDYLINSGISLETKAISEPKFPLIQSSSKNLLKLYMNDVGLLTNILYQNNINAMMNDDNTINLGSVYETVVAQELIAHEHKLFYYDRKKVGEVDFLIDDYDNLSVLPLEVKSGKNNENYFALIKLLQIPNYNIKKGIVFSNDNKVSLENNILFLPIYYIMFI